MAISGCRLDGRGQTNTGMLMLPDALAPLARIRGELGLWYCDLRKSARLMCANQHQRVHTVSSALRWEEVLET